MPRVVVQRVYELERLDGSYRVLVDRLWPRGVSREHAEIDEWAKDLAPTSDLRQWYAHDPAKFQEFAQRYRQELKRRAAQDAIDNLRAVAKRDHVTLVTATRDVEHSGARVLRDVLIARKRADSDEPIPHKEDRR